ncbi:MAG: twin-arginine translocase subunit TatC [Candidatus Bipolaricaulota bacterium]
MEQTPIQILLDRTDQLRARLIRVILLVIGIAVVAYIYRDTVLDFLTRPLVEDRLIFIHPTEAFFTYIKISLFAGVLLGAPYILYQLIMVSAPLFEGNVNLTRSFLVITFLAGTLFFYVGAGFALLGVMPFAIRFLKGISGEKLEAVFTVGNYASFTMAFTLIFGFLFELPVISYGLSRMGLITKRTLISQWRIVVAGAAVLAAVLTPPDPITQMFLWGPLLVLYGLSILLVAFAERGD